MNNILKLFFHLTKISDIYVLAKSILMFIDWIYKILSRLICKLLLKHLAFMITNYHGLLHFDIHCKNLKQVKTWWIFINYVRFHEKTPQFQPKNGNFMAIVLIYFLIYRPSESLLSFHLMKNLHTTKTSINQMFVYFSWKNRFIFAMKFKISRWQMSFKL